MTEVRRWKTDNIKDRYKQKNEDYQDYLGLSQMDKMRWEMHLIKTRLHPNTKQTYVKVCVVSPEFLFYFLFFYN